LRPRNRRWTAEFGTSDGIKVSSRIETSFNTLAEAIAELPEMAAREVRQRACSQGRYQGPAGLSTAER
jgi:hypothetical protein